MNTKQRILRATAVILVIGIGYTHSELKDLYHCVVSDASMHANTDNEDNDHTNIELSRATYRLTTTAASWIVSLFTLRNSQ